MSQADECDSLVVEIAVMCHDNFTGKKPNYATTTDN